ncbi:MAG: hypothetical protein GT601_05985 [Acidaminobacter sp.]|uniref:terminase small subunit n=1 Tax=Acidaminobacter sp. TaxID=1872102 RepID=UPI00138532A6|nr:terminase small subunit [Acidaminobacter sp.]MZQ97205.1 hypothetical protein [Acidaminobacter sp.]
MAGIGNKKEYPTAADLENAINKYFDEITRDTVLKENYIAGYKDDGEPIVAEREALNRLGEPVVVEEFLVKPSVINMCVKLGITRSALSLYRTYGEDYLDTITRACARIEAYKVDQLDDKGKATNGIIFDLKNNHDYRDKQEIEQTVEHKGVEVSIKVIE